MVKLPDVAKSVSISLRSANWRRLERNSGSDFNGEVSDKLVHTKPHLRRLRCKRIPDNRMREEAHCNNLFLRLLPARANYMHELAGRYYFVRLFN